MYMKKILLVVLIFFSLTSFAQNLITNGGFEGSLSQWQNLLGGDAVGTFTLETSDVQSGTGAMKAEITTAGTNAWDVQSIHSGWASVLGTTYTLTFYAKAIGAPSRIRIVQQNSTYDAQDFDIPTSWQQFTWTFTASDNDLQLKIHYFQSGTFILDDFVILNPVTSNDPKTITVNTNNTYQEMVGFGGALTWHSDRITRSSKKNEMAQLLFDDLGADIVRLKSWYYPLNYPASKSPQTMETDWFVPHFTGTNELAALAKQYNPDIDILLSCWGPPSSLKSNDQLNGGTLKKNNGQFMYSEYAQFWNDILDNIAFNPDYISIQNEPGYENTGWTTTAWRPEETTDYPGYSEGLDAVYNKIKTRPYVPAMIGPETENIGGAVWDNSVNTFRSMASTVKDKAYLSAYAYHLYNYGNPGNISQAPLNMIRDEFADKPNFMTEFSSANYDWLQTAHMIQLNLLEANTSAYIYWEMMWDETSEQAMIAVDNSGDYTVSPYFYALKHFSKNIDKGDARVEVQGSSSTLKISGFLNPGKDKLTLVMSNIGTLKETVHLNLGSLAVISSELIQSTAGSYYNNLGQADLSEAIELPAQSLTTLVIDLDPLVTSNKASINRSGIELFPVPASDLLHIKGLPESDISWSVVTPQGSTAKSGSGAEVNIKDLQGGVYFLKVKEHTVRFIKM